MVAAFEQPWVNDKENPQPRTRLWHCRDPDATYYCLPGSSAEAAWPSCSAGLFCSVTRFFWRSVIICLCGFTRSQPSAGSSVKNTSGIVPRFPAGCLADQVSAPEENENAAEPSQLHSHRPCSTLTPQPLRQRLRILRLSSGLSMCGFHPIDWVDADNENPKCLKACNADCNANFKKCN